MRILITHWVIEGKHQLRQATATPRWRISRAGQKLEKYSPYRMEKERYKCIATIYSRDKKVYRENANNSRISVPLASGAGISTTVRLESSLSYLLNHKVQEPKEHQPRGRWIYVAGEERQKNQEG